MGERAFAYITSNASQPPMVGGGTRVHEWPDCAIGPARGSSSQGGGIGRAVCYQDRAELGGDKQTESTNFHNCTQTLIKDGKT